VKVFTKVTLAPYSPSPLDRDSFSSGLLLPVSVEIAFAVDHSDSDSLRLVGKATLWLRRTPIVSSSG